MTWLSIDKKKIKDKMKSACKIITYVTLFHTVQLFQNIEMNFLTFLFKYEEKFQVPKILNK